MNEKRCKAINAVVAKFKGDHTLYLEYDNALIELPSSKQIRPTADCLNYLKKIGGKQSGVQIFNSTGGSDTPTVDFA